MDKQTCFEKIMKCGLVPIVRLDNAQAAYETGLALYKGGVDVVEITMTVPNALTVISDLRRQFQDDVVVGAGTVLDGETARAAILAGAQFLVSPNLSLDLIEMCHRYGVVSVPGALTPTEILAAWSAGADVVKVFPAGLLGGPKYIAAVKEATPQVRLLGLGKVNLETAVDYIKSGADLIGVGAALVDKTAIANKQFDLITEKAKQFKHSVAVGRGLA